MIDRDLTSTDEEAINEAQATYWTDTTEETIEALGIEVFGLGY